MCADDCHRGSVAWNNSGQHFYTKLKLNKKCTCSGCYANVFWYSKFGVFFCTRRRVYQYESIEKCCKLYLNMIDTHTSYLCVFELAAQTCSAWTWSLRLTINMMNLYLLFVRLCIWTFINLLLAYTQTSRVRKRLKTKTSSRWNFEHRLLRRE